MFRLTRVPVDGYELQLTPSHGWLDFRQLDTIFSWFILRLTTSCSQFYPASDSSFAGWSRLAAEFYFNISSKSKDLFCKIHDFYGLFSTTCFQLSLIQALAAASRTLKKLKEAWRSFKTLAATDSSRSGWFKLWRLIRDLRPINYLQNFDLDSPPDIKNV